MGSGRFVTEDKELDGPLWEYHNGRGPWQGGFRIGHFDAVAHRYAANVAGHLDGLVVTGIDRVVELPEWKYATHYVLPDADETGKYAIADETGDVRDIVPSSNGDRQHVRRLTDMMFAAKPVYDSIQSPEADDIIRTIEREMGRRVVLASYGPTVDDKQILDGDVIWQ